MSYLLKQLLIWITAREQKPDTAGISDDHTTNLQQLQPNGADLCSGQFGLFQCSLSDVVDQDVGKAGEYYSPLVGPPNVCCSFSPLLFLPFSMAERCLAIRGRFKSLMSLRENVAGQYFDWLKLGGIMCFCRRDVCKVSV